MRSARAVGRAPILRPLPDEYNAELSLFLTKKLRVAQIRDFLPGEFTPPPLADVMAVRRARETAGTIRLVAKAARGK